VEHLVAEGGFLDAGVHAVPPAISDRVARHKLRAIGVRWDDLTERQLAYLSGWRSGT
jgi:adenosylhomocysteinase